MIHIKTFQNYEEFKEIFGIIEHGNGVKSRKNKILLSCLKDRKLLHWWLGFRKLAKSHGINDTVLDDIDYLSATGMNDLKKFADALLWSIPNASRLWSGCHLWVGRKIVFQDTGWRMLSKTMELDALNGICEDGDTKAIRYRNVERKKVFKMKAGKFITRCIEDLSYADVIPEQLKRWVGEEFARKWQSYAEANVPNVRYELHVDDNFAAIYDGGRCIGDFHSCMEDMEYFSFYKNSVDCSAAYLTNTDGGIVARCIIYNEVKDCRGNIYRIAERQYATDQDTTLMQILVDRLIKEGMIDGYKRVGAGCYDTSDFVLNNGKSLDRTLYIDCRLEDGDTVSFQDSFQFFNYDEQAAYNDEDFGRDAKLSITDGEVKIGTYSQWNGERILDAEEDEYYDDYVRSDQLSRIWHNGRFSTICEDHADEDPDLRWSEMDECYYHVEDCVYAEELDDYIDLSDACEDIDEKWQREGDCDWSEYHKAYVLAKRAHFSNLVNSYIDEERAEQCPVCGDWVPDDYEDVFKSDIVDGNFCCEECMRDAEAHALRVVS